MEYFDTNIYIYAFCNNIDDKNQKDIIPYANYII